MSTKLREAFGVKEKAELFLSNLEKLKSEGSIKEPQYGVLKAEYTKMRDDAISKVNSIKTYIKRELDDKTAELSISKLKVDNLEARFKVGQIPPEAYLKQQKRPKRRLDELERRVSELQALVNSSRAADISAPQQGKKLFGLNLRPQSKNQLPAQEIPVIPVIPVIPTAPSVPEVTEPVAPSGIYLTNLQIMPNRVLTGSTVGIIVVITNGKQDTLKHKVELKINDKIKDSREIALAPGVTQEVTFTTLADAPGDYEVAIGDLTGRFSVISTTQQRPLRQLE